MEHLEMLVWVTFLAGVVGTGLGGVIGAIFKSDSPVVISLLLSFAAGVMISIVCFDLVHAALDTKAGLYWVLGGMSVGIAGVCLLNYAIDRHANSHVPKEPDHPKTADCPGELIHLDHLVEHKRKGEKVGLFIAGMVMASAIALHNLPEGMTIGASFVYTDDLLSGPTLLLAWLIGLHNIPEGMAVAVPLISGGMGRPKAVLVTAASGIPIILGALLGFWIGDVGPHGLCLSLSFASGAMLYVIFGEIFPQAVLLCKSKVPAFSLLAGMIVGMLVIFA
jgi:ZIP family zinc transporter